MLKNSRIVLLLIALSAGQANCGQIRFSTIKSVDRMSLRTLSLLLRLDMK
jgi:hypothetical protein